MAGKIVPYILVGLIQTTLIIAVGRWLFDVPFSARIPDLYLAAGVFIAATLMLGLLISTIAATQFQAVQLSFFTMLPSILLSGFMFPFDGMPAGRPGDRPGTAVDSLRRPGAGHRLAGSTDR